MSAALGTRDHVDLTGGATDGRDLAALIRCHAAERPVAAFLRDARTGNALTFGELAHRAAGWAAHLDAAGVPPGGRVLLALDDPVELAVAHLGVIAAGRCSVPVDPSAPEADHARTVRATTPSLFVRTPVELPAGLGERGRDERGPDERGPGEVRLHTSGSTGAPKVVALSEAQLLHVAGAVARHHRLGPDDVGYNPLPLFHINAQVVALLASLVAGAQLVLDRRFSRSGFPALLDRYDITWVNAVPAILTILAADDPPAGVGRLRFVRSASAPLPVTVREDIERRWGSVVVESYGMTEAASQITATPLEGGAPAGSAGRPVDTEVRVRDGRLQIRGPGVITSYVDGRARASGEPGPPVGAESPGKPGPPVGADRFDAEGWLDTGDLGRIDADGWVYVRGRADDVINRGGELVYPREVEEVLLGDPRVREAVVLGRPDPVLGEVPVACVVADPTDFADLLDTLRERCTRLLARAKRPVDIRVVGSLPHGTNGKIRRRDMRLDDHQEVPDR